MQTLGASILYRERVSAVRRAVDEHVEKLWNQYDPVSPMEDKVERYSPSNDSVAEFIRQHDADYKHDCRQVFEKTIVALKTRLDPNSSRWKSTMPLFLSGGGSFMPFYQSFIAEMSNDLVRLYGPCRGFRILSLPKPENLVAAVDEQNYQRLAVAWGLSYRETDIGTPERPSKNDAVSPRQRYDWGGREFISKDMV